MAEGDTTQQTDQQSAETTQETQQTAQQTQAERTVPYTRFQEVNTKLRGLETQLAELSTKATSADELAAQLATVTADLARTRVAVAKGVPAELHGLLTGKDEAELSANADLLMKFVKAQAAPNIDATARTEAKPTFTVAQISDHNFFNANKDAILLAQREGRIVIG